MTDPDASAGRAAVPMIPYRNLQKMIDWLCQAFGFQRQLIAFDESGSIAHAQLALGGSVVMVVPAGQGPFEDVLVCPDQVERIATQATYLLVDDVETRHARATESGAEVMFEMEFNNAAGRGYACRDPEGHIWLFGSYVPWRATTKHAMPVAKKGIKARAAMLAALAFASLVLVGWISWQTAGYQMLSARPWHLDVGADDSSATLDAAQDARRAAERRATDLADRLAREEVAHKKEVGASMEARNALERDLTAKGEEAKQAKLRWQQERDARIAVERAGKEASQLLERERAGRMAADLAAKEAQQVAARERAARVNTERQAQEAIGRVLQERSARAAAELAANELRNQLLLSRGANGQDKLPELRGQLLAERQARDALERAAQEAQEQLVRERTSRHNAERALQESRQTQNSAPLSCWSCPAGTACETSR